MLWILAACVVLLLEGANGAFSIEQVHNSRYVRRSGLAEYAWTHAKYNAELPSGVATKLAGNVDIDAPVDAWNQTVDKEYLSPVFLGTPPQLTMIDLDTGSADFWVLSSDTPETVLNGQKIYRPEKSETAIEVPNATWAITYGDGSYASGSIYLDTVQFGSLNLTNATLQSATRVSHSIIKDEALSGIMGLAIDLDSTTVPNQPTTLDALGDMLDEHVFGVDLRYHAPGQYHFGYINASAYTGEIEWRPNNGGSPFWEIYVEGFHVEGSNVWYQHRWPMVVDTGTSLMLLPSELAASYWDRVPGAALDPLTDIWSYPCNQTEALPDLHFGFTNGWNASVPGHFMKFDEAEDEPGSCFGGIQNDFGGGFSLLGDTWLKAFYVVFDWDNDRVGIAKKRL